MAKDTDSAVQREKDEARRSALGVSGTSWGYVIRPCEDVLVRAAYGEMAALFFAVLTGMGAYGLWLIPGSNSAPELVPFKIAGMVVFFVIAGMLYMIARRGLCQEVHVDLKRRELRVARRNRKGRATVSVVSMDDVERVYLQRAKAALLRNRLCLKLLDQSAPMEVAEGSEAELAPLLQRLALDLNKLPRDTVVKRGKDTVPETRIPTAFAAR